MEFLHKIKINFSKNKLLKEEIYDVLDINKLLKVPFMNLSSGQKKSNDC